MSKEEREIYLASVLERINRLDDEGAKILLSLAEGMVIGKDLAKNGGTNESETVPA